VGLVALDQDFFSVSSVPPADHHSNNSSPAHDVRNSPEHAAHYHILSLYVRGVVSDPADHRVRWFPLSLQSRARN
jgi:hypothetical protein